jgi:hypothetical protein
MAKEHGGSHIGSFMAEKCVSRITSIQVLMSKTILLPYHGSLLWWPKEKSNVFFYWNIIENTDKGVWVTSVEKTLTLFLHLNVLSQSNSSIFKCKTLPLPNHWQMKGKYAESRCTSGYYYFNFFASGTVCSIKQQHPLLSRIPWILSFLMVGYTLKFLHSILVIS